MAVPEGMRIDIHAGGPYVVSGNVPLVRVKIVTENGESVAFEETYRYPQQETYALCRCGASKNKPFCDGSHDDIGFVGKRRATKRTYMEEAEAIEGDGITLFDATRLCIGARFCDRAGSVWALTEHSGEKDVYREAAIVEAELCPAGRLVMLDNNSKEAFELDYEPSIALIEDPASGASSAIWVRGGIPVYDENGEQLEIRNRVTLCRCGKSRNMPFCDGSHYLIGFDDGHIND